MITRALRSRRLGTTRLGAELVVVLAVSASYATLSGAPLTDAGGSASRAPRSVTAAASLADTSKATIPFQLHMDFFSNESHQPSVIDPQVFVSAPGTPAGTGPQMIPHVADVAPAAKTDLPDTPLLAADGTPLGITLSQWTSAAGSLSLTCDSGRETAVDDLRGLVPGGVYSIFVVHLTIQGPGRFTPFGDSAGTTNNFTASADGTATPTTTLDGCLNPQEAVVVIWHSDHTSHGASGGTMGVDWHNSLIAKIP